MPIYFVLERSKKAGRCSGTVDEADAEDAFDVRHLSTESETTTSLRSDKQLYYSSPPTKKTDRFRASPNERRIERGNVGNERTDGRASFLNGYHFRRRRQRRLVLERRRSPTYRTPGIARRKRRLRKRRQKRRRARPETINNRQRIIREKCDVLC